MPEFPGTASTNYFVNITQSYDITTPSLLGFVTTQHDDKSEFFNGELSGSAIIVEDGNLNPIANLPYLRSNPIETFFTPVFFKSTSYPNPDIAISTFLNPALAPGDGEIYLYWDSGSFNI